MGGSRLSQVPHFMRSRVCGVAHAGEVRAQPLHHQHPVATLSDGAADVGAANTSVVRAFKVTHRAVSIGMGLPVCGSTCEWCSDEQMRVGCTI